MENLKLNETPVRTAKNFRINNIKLENIEIPEVIPEFENVTITGDTSKIDIEQNADNIDINLAYGLSEELAVQVKAQANQKIKLNIKDTQNEKSKTENLEKAEAKIDFKFDDEKLANIDYENKRIILVTTHRRENLGEPMRHVYKALKDIVNEFDDVEIVFPVHKNPKVREVVNEELGNIKAVHLIDPLDYEPFANLMHRAFLVLTDSGGIQEEAPSLGKPVLVLRDTTERPEAVKAGTVKLIGTERQKVYEETKYLLTDHDEYQRMANTCNPYGDGKASKRIIGAILYHYGLSQEKPDSFIAGK